MGDEGLNQGEAIGRVLRGQRSIDGMVATFETGAVVVGGDEWFNEAFVLFGKDGIEGLINRARLASVSRAASPDEERFAEGEMAAASGD